MGRSRRARRCDRERVPLARRGEGRPGCHSRPHTARVVACRLRPLNDRRRRDSRLSDLVAFGGRARAGRLGHEGTRLRGRGAAREAGRPGAAGARAADRDRRGGARRDACRRRRAGARVRARAARCARHRGKPGRARGRADVPLHLGDDRPAEGLRTDSAELRVDGRVRRRGRRPVPRRRHDPPVPAACAQLCAADRVCRRGEGLDARVLPGRPRRDERAQ